MEGTNDQQARMQQAIALYGRKQMDEAEAIFRELQPYPDTRSDASYGLGLIALERGSKDEAYGWLCMVNHGSTRYADARNYMAEIEHERGNTGAAARLCSEALKLDPNHQRAAALALELQKHVKATPPPDGSAVSAAATPTQPAGAAKRPGGDKTDIWLPSDEEQLKEYSKRMTAKAREDWWIERWKGLPLVGKIHQISLGLLFFGIFAVLAYFFSYGFGNIPGIPGGLETGVAAPESWCRATYETWKSNPNFYGEATLISLRENNCQRWGIPPEVEVNRIPPRTTSSPADRNNSDLDQPQAQLYHVVRVSPDDVLKVRSAPGARNPVVGEIPYDGQDIRVIEVQGVGGRGRWARIEYGGIAGWVNFNFLERQAS